MNACNYNIIKINVPSLPHRQDKTTHLVQNLILNLGKNSDTKQIDSLVSHMRSFFQTPPFDKCKKIHH